MDRIVDKLKQLNKDAKCPCGKCELNKDCAYPGRCPAYLYWRKVYLSRKVVKETY